MVCNLLIPILLLCVVQVPAATFSTPKLAKKSFTLDDFLNHTFVDNQWAGRWINDVTYLYKENGNYFLRNLATNKIVKFLNEKDLNAYNGPHVTITEDHKYVLIKYNVAPVFRHSSIANYAWIKIGNIQKPLLLDQVQYVQLYNNSILYVKGNNIYYQPLLDAATKPILITRDGTPGVTYNGVPDWVYEEEVLSTDSALWPSASSEYLVYAKFDDINVKEFTYNTYGNSSDTNQYPKLVNIRYPKAGSINPMFSLYAYNFKSKVTKPIILHFKPIKTHKYILYDVTWRRHNKILVTYTNRIQTMAVVEECNVFDGLCTKFSEVENSKGWVEILRPVVSLNGMVLVDRQNNFDTLLYYNDSAKTPITIKIGDLTISKLHGINGYTLYFEGTEATHHSEQHVYSVDLIKHSRICITCNWKVYNETCKFATADFSKKLSFMAKICKGPGPTYIELVNVKKNTSFVYEKNDALRTRLAKMNMPIIKNLTVKIPNTKFAAAVRLFLPHNFQMTKKYPLLVNVYAGPNSKQIQDTFSIGLHHYLTTNKGYIYALIDGRGSGKRGRDLMYSVYKNLGLYEVKDQIDTVKYLRNTLKYIDPERIGIWGWSYGGFSTAWTISRDSEVFTCGVSVAPVTNFLYYDSIYTERYMDLPHSNKLAYTKTDVTKVPQTFRGKNFLLVHGNADDNVHYQQSMVLARALELADVQFEQISYPDENHSLRGVLRHLYHSLDAFWDKHFKQSKSSPQSNRAWRSNRASEISFHILLFILVAGNAITSIY